jgi:hypothetical protein
LLWLPELTSAFKNPVFSRTASALITRFPALPEPMLPTEINPPSWTTNCPVVSLMLPPLPVMKAGLSGESLLASATMPVA